MIRNIVARRPELGAYELTSRLPGLTRPGKTELSNITSDTKNPLYAPNGTYDLDPQCDSILRKTYATPSFVLGTSMVPALPKESWSAISSQNRWDGVLFSGNATSCIFVQPARPAKGSLYNAEWSVQDKGVLLIQRLKTSTGADNQMMWFSGDLKRVEENGWIFVEAANAFAAIKVVSGAWAWENKSQYWRDAKNYKEDAGIWLVPKDQFSPIIVEVATKASFTDYEAFKKAILKNALQVSPGVVNYSSAFYKTQLTLFSDFSQPPQINGKTAVYNTPECYSGLLEAPFGGDTVKLKAFDKELLFKFGKK